MMSQKRAYTLIKLLVVIAIISVLAALLFPVFTQSREKARSTACLSNLKQLGIAYMLYVQDHDDLFPLNSHAPTRPGTHAFSPPPNLVATRSSAQHQACYGTQGPNAVYAYTRSFDI